MNSVMLPISREAACCGVYVYLESTRVGLASKEQLRRQNIAVFEDAYRKELKKKRLISSNKVAEPTRSTTLSIKEDYQVPSLEITNSQIQIGGLWVEPSSGMLIKNGTFSIGGTCQFTDSPILNITSRGTISHGYWSESDCAEEEPSVGSVGCSMWDNALSAIKSMSNNDSMNWVEDEGDIDNGYPEEEEDLESEEDIDNGYPDEEEEDFEFEEDSDNGDSEVEESFISDVRSIVWSDDEVEETSADWYEDDGDEESVDVDSEEEATNSGYSEEEEYDELDIPNITFSEEDFSAFDNIEWEEKEPETVEPISTRNHREVGYSNTELGHKTSESMSRQKQPDHIVSERPVRKPINKATKPHHKLDEDSVRAFVKSHKLCSEVDILKYFEGYDPIKVKSVIKNAARHYKVFEKHGKFTV